MANIDQADGLRRLLAAPRPRVLTFLSALKEDEKSRMLVNLGVTLARQGHQILMVDAQATSGSIGAWFNARKDRTLLDVARQQRTMQEAVKNIVPGLSVTMLSGQAGLSSCLPKESARLLSRTFDLVVHRSDLVIVDGEMDANDAFPLTSLDDGELVVQVSPDPAAIKAAYGLIKRMSGRMGRRSFTILVSGASEKEANLIYANMAQASQRYLAVTLHFAGCVPDDEHVRKAAHEGRSVIDAFPKARASMAFSRLAGQFAATARSALCPESFSGQGVGLGI